MHHRRPRGRGRALARGFVAGVRAVLFVLGLGLGLGRVAELAAGVGGLRFGHRGRARAAVVVRDERPDRPRTVPLWRDAGTLEDLAAWRADRLTRGAKPAEPFICSWQVDRKSITFSRHTLRKRFRTACRVLGPDRLKTLTIHHGRHTFISHALAGGRTLAEVRDAAGHSDVSITSEYLHVAVEDDTLGNLIC